MSECHFNILGERFVAFSSSEKYSFDRTDSFAVEISYSQCCDVFAKSCVNSLLTSESEALVGGAHQMLYRGLPLDSVDVETKNGKIEIFRTGANVLGYRIPKYKQLFTKSSVEIMGASFCAWDYLAGVGASVRFIECCDTDFISDKSTLSMAFDEKRGFSATVFYSFSSDSAYLKIVSANVFPHLSRIDALNLLLCISRKRGIKQIIIDGFIANLSDDMIFLSLN